MCVLVAHSCPTLCGPVDCSLPGSSVLGILQARILEWVAFPFCGDLPNQGSNPGLPHCRWILYQLSYLMLCSTQPPDSSGLQQQKLLLCSCSMSIRDWPEVFCAVLLSLRNPRCGRLYLYASFFAEAGKREHGELCTGLFESHHFHLHFTG